MLIRSHAFTKANNLRCSNGDPYRYEIFCFDQEPLALWRISKTGSEMAEFVEKIGWSKITDRQEYRSDIDHCVFNTSAYYYELPLVVLEMLEGFPC